MPEVKAKRSLRTGFALGILLGYSATLAVSAGHLAQWYRLTLGDLPSSLGLALAVTLEANAFLLSLLSNYLLKDSAWAKGGALLALFLVWLGNYLSMSRAAQGMAWPEVFAASLFVPIGTYVMGKVLGEILKRGGAEGEGVPKERETPSQVGSPKPSLEVLPYVPQEALFGERQGEEVSRERLISFLETPRTLEEVERAFPQVPSSALLDLLRSLRSEGVLRYRMGLWEVIRSG